MTAPEPIGPRRVQLAGFAAEISDLLERFRPFAQADANPDDLDDRTRALLAAMAGLTAARAGMQKAMEAP